MTRVAFVMASPGQGWLGGLSYFRNLFQALRSFQVLWPRQAVRDHR